jgi:glycosyltransferase involved in cell wall biosynthesis
MQSDIVILILTYNEQENIEQCLNSISGWAAKTYVIDSGSTDGTLEKVRQFDVEVKYNKFVNFSKQRNFALGLLEKDFDGWVLFLDADEYLTSDIKSEILVKIKTDQFTNFFLNRRFYWGDTWIKRGYYPSNIIRLFKNGYARCEDRSVNEHLIVVGETGFISSDFIHKCNKPISSWVEKHIKRARLEADELFNKNNNQINSSLFKNTVETKRWIRNNIWERLPIFLRPFLLFFYRLFIQLAILDGRHAFGYHFLQTLWFTMLIDIFYLETKIKSKKND